MTLAGRVSPLGNPRINGCSPLPTAYRSVPRPSSPLNAKASTKCPSHRLIAFRVRILKTGSRLDFPPTQRRRRTTGFPRSTAAPSGSNFKTRLFVSDPKPQPWRCAIPYEGMVLHRPAGTRPGASDRQPLFTMSVSRGGYPRSPPEGGAHGSRSRRVSLRQDAIPSPEPRPKRARTKMVELNGIEPMTSCLQSTRSPN